MAITDFFRRNPKVAKVDEVAVSDLKSVDVSNTDTNSVKSVPERLNQTQSSQVDEIVEKLKKDLKSKDEGKVVEKGKSFSVIDVEEKAVQKMQEVLPDELLNQTQLGRGKRSDEEQAARKDSVKEVSEQQVPTAQSGLFLSDVNRDDSRFQQAQKSVSQLDERETRREIESELKSFNIADFRVNENGAFLDPSKYYKFLALRERAGGLGMTSEFSKIEATIEFIKYQELEKASRRPSGADGLTEQNIFDDKNKSEQSSLSEDLRDLMEGFAKLRESLGAAIISGAIRVIQEFMDSDDVEEVSNKTQFSNSSSKKGKSGNQGQTESKKDPQKVTTYVIENPAAPEAQEFVRNVENVVSKLDKVGLTTKVERDHETGAQYFETALPASYKGSLDINNINLEDIATSIRNTRSEKPSAAVSEEEKAPKLRILVGSLIAIKKLQEKQGIKSKSFENIIDKALDKAVIQGDETISAKDSYEGSFKKGISGLLKDKPKDQESRDAEEVVGKFAKMILEKRAAAAKQDNQNQI